MDEIHQKTSTSVTRYVLVVLAVKTLIGVSFGAFSYLTEYDMPNLSSPVNIVAVGLGLLWYSKVVNEPMAISEILWFASGVALVDLALSFLWLILLTWMSGQPLTLNGAELAVFGKAGTLTNRADQIVILSLIMFSVLMTFGLAAFFAWLMTRKLPKK